jgi:hypothetical protein
MKKAFGLSLMVLYLFLFQGCEFAVTKGIEMTGTLEGAFGSNDSMYYVLYEDGDENAPFYFYTDDSTIVYDIQGKIASDEVNTILAAHERYLIKIRYDKSLTEEIPTGTMVVTAGSVAYYALKVEQYLEAPEGYAVCEIHNYEALLGYEMVIKRIYETKFGHW